VCSEEDNPLSDESGEKYIAQYSFTASTDLEQDDEPQLSLKQGDEVLVTDTTDPDWYTGRLISQDGSVGGKVGIFPAEYVRRSNDSEQMGSNGSREGSDLDDSTAAPAEIDAEDLIDEEGEGGGDEEEEEDEDPQWKSHRIEKLRKAVRREHHGNIGIVSDSLPPLPLHLYLYTSTSTPLPLPLHLYLYTSTSLSLPLPPSPSVCVRACGCGADSVSDLPSALVRIYAYANNAIITNANASPGAWGLAP
jgi:hypothetical protein